MLPGGQVSAVPGALLAVTLGGRAWTAVPVERQVEALQEPRLGESLVAEQASAATRDGRRVASPVVRCWDD